MNIEEPNSKYVIYKTYPEKLNNDTQDIDECTVRYEIHTQEPLPKSFDKKLVALVDKYAPR